MTLSIHNPATEERIQEVSSDDAVSIREKVSAAHSWVETPLAERKACMLRFAALLEKNKEMLAQQLCSEMGKPITQARNEVTYTQDNIHWFVEHAEVAFAASESGGERLSYDPLGKIANISAWNYPFYVGINVLVPALLAANAVLYKPSEFTTLTGLSIASLLHEAGVPKDVLIPVIGAGDAGATLLTQGIDGVFFTGSHATSKQIQGAVASRRIRLQLELGGKDPAYVCDDADIQAAVDGIAEGVYDNAGQSCCSIERIYVQEERLDAFVNALVEKVQTFTLGDPKDPNTYIGPLARGAQLAVLEAQVSDAVERGAKVLLGGKRSERPGYFFEPTVLVNVNHEMDVMREESFGPIIAIQSVKDDAEAIELMNDTRYGLTAAVFSAGRARAESILKRLDTGTAYWNCCDRVKASLPWSGRRDSGIGCTLGIDGMRAFVQPRSWHFNEG